MRDRLIEVITKSGLVDTWNHHTDDFKEPNPIDELADYLLENGVIVPPCKVGDTAFFVDVICDEEGEEKLGMSIGKVVSFSTQKEGLWAYCRYEDGLTYWHKVDEEIGITLFFTQEEAEQALKGGAE